MKISVVIPVYNTERYLERCWTSLANQKFSDFEAIFVDDRSTDGSGAILKRFARRDPRVRVMQSPTNQGAGGARNIGIKAARGEYVAFVDSDDFVDAEFLESAYLGTIGGKYDVVKFGFRGIGPDLQLLRKVVPAQQLIEDTGTLKNKMLFTDPHPWNKIWRKELFTKNDIWFPVKAYWEDLATVPLLIFKARNISVVNDCLYNYFERDGSTVNTVTDRHLVDFLRAFDFIKEFLLREGLYDQEKSDYHQLLSIVMEWYGEKVLASQVMDRRQKADAIRYCSLLFLGYAAKDDSLRTHTPEENIRLMAACGGASPMSHKNEGLVEEERMAAMPKHRHSSRVGSQLKSALSRFMKV